MTTVVAVVVVAVLVGAWAGWIARRSTERRIAVAIGGRADADPIIEHRRQLAAQDAERHDAVSETQRLSLALDALTSGVIVTDGSGRVLLRNRLARDISPRSHEQTLVNATTTELIESAMTGTPVEREVEIFGPPKRVLFIHALPIAESGAVVGALAVIDDVTDHHRIESTRRDFVANLSHEMRTPVGALSLLAEMLVDETDPKTRAHLSNRVVVETARLSDTIDDLLELSRVESAIDSYEDMIVVQDLVDDSIARVHTVAESSGVTVGAVMPSDPIRTRGNRDQMVSAVVNLVENAVKYSDVGDSVSVRVRCEDDVLLIAVQDTGRGIPARDLDRIFERFYRVDRSRDANTGGSGIGLSIVRHVALSHGGSVRVESSEGEGSTFTIEVPIIRAIAADPSPTDPSPTHEVT